MAPDHLFSLRKIRQFSGRSDDHDSIKFISSRSAGVLDVDILIAEFRFLADPLIVLDFVSCYDGDCFHETIF